MKSFCKPARLLQLTELIRTIPSRTVGSGVIDCVDLKHVKPFNQIPGPKGIYNIPYIGAAFHFKPFTDNTVDGIHLVFDRVMEQYGSLVRIRLGEWTVLVEDPEDIEVVLKNEGKYPKRQMPFLNRLFVEHYDVKGIAELDGEEWQKFRSSLNPLLMRAKSAQHYLPVQNEVADDLVALLKRPFTPEDLVKILYRYACESISVVTYNTRLGYLDPEIEKHPEKLQILADTSTLFELMNETQGIPPFVLRYFPLKAKKRYFAAGHRIITQTKEYYDKTIKNFNRQLKENTIKPDEHNFMFSLLMTGKLNAQKMTSIASSLFTAGTHSTARNLQNVLYNLAGNPDKQQKLYEEIFSAIGRHGPLTQDAQNSMKYLLACVKESFRVLYPIPSGSQRYLPTDIVLQGYRIPAGTSVLLMNQRTVKNPKYFPEPESFIPERWLRDEEGKRETPIPSYALLPFGLGPRQCIGKRFAEQETYLAVVKILQTFQVSLAPDQKEIEQSYTPFGAPKEPVKFVLTERKD